MKQTTKRTTLTQTFAVSLLVVMTIAVALAAVLPISGTSDGYWVSRFGATTSAPNDTGVAISYYFSQTDSRAFGLLFRGGTGALDTRIASFGSTTPFYFFGSVSSSGSSLRYAQLSDTARLTLLTTSYADTAKAAAATTTWSNEFFGTTGTATDSFLYLSANFGVNTVPDTLAWSADDANLSILQATDSIVIAKGASATQALRFRAVRDKVTDSGRIVLIRPSGRIHDTYMIRTSGGANGGETFSMPNTFVFESGVTSIFAFYWNSDSSRLQIKEGTVTCDVQKTSITGGSGTAVGSDLTSNIRSVSLSVNSIGLASPVASVLLTGNGNAPGSNNAADLYLTIDTNSSIIGFETRFPNSVFDVSIIDSAGGTVSKLPSGQKHLLTLNYAFNGVPLSQIQRGKIFHYNLSSNSWEAITTTVTVDTNGNSGNAVAIAEVTEYSQYAFGTLSPGSGISNDDNNCVASSAVLNTSFTGALPGLRNFRDGLMVSALGRILAHGYYTSSLAIMGALCLLFLFGIHSFARSSSKA